MDNQHEKNHQLDDLTSSRLRCFRRCAREHYYRYERLRRPRGNELALAFGSLFHAGVEEWRRSVAALQAQGICDPAQVSQGSFFDPLRSALAGVDRAIQDGVADDGDVDEFEVARVEEMLRGYHCRWFAHDLAHVLYIAIEGTWKMSLVNPATGRSSRTFSLTGKTDATATVDYRLWVFENKTTSADITPGSPYWVRLRMDDQVSLYFDGAGARHGRDAFGCMYDVAKKPGIKPLLATPDENRKFTKGKGCKECGGSAGGKRGIVRGSGRMNATDGVSATLHDCIACGGTGWKEAPRLIAQQRDHDETVSEFRERVRHVLMEAPEAYYQRGDVVRLDDEMQQHRSDRWALAQQIRACQKAGAWPRNPDACVRYNRFCGYFDVCTGTAAIDDDSRFVDSLKHPELADEKEVA